MAGADTRAEDGRLRAFAFWVGHHQYDQPSPRIGPAAVEPTAPEPAAAGDPSIGRAAQPDPERQARDEARRERIAELARMVPDLKRMATDARPAVRATVARCFAILATGGQAPADREIWRILLGLAKYDDDAEVRLAAETALEALERHGAKPAQAS